MLLPSILLFALVERTVAGEARFRPQCVKISWLNMVKILSSNTFISRIELNLKSLPKYFLIW